MLERWKKILEAKLQMEWILHFFLSCLVLIQKQMHWSVLLIAPVATNAVEGFLMYEINYLPVLR